MILIPLPLPLPLPLVVWWQYEKAKQDDGLSDLSDILGELKDMAMDMGSEIERFVCFLIKRQTSGVRKLTNSESYSIFVQAKQITQSSPGWCWRDKYASERRESTYSTSTRKIDSTVLWFCGSFMEIFFLSIIDPWTIIVLLSNLISSLFFP